MVQDSVFEDAATNGVVPVITIESADSALRLADALLDGGLPIAEITFRTQAAADAIRLLAAERPQVFLGAGTVLTRANLEAGKACGARFGVSPGLNPDIVKAARDMGLPFLPGVATPTEIEHALSLGCKWLKFFPSEPLGGVKMLKSLTAPYAHMGVRFVPTGGINASNLEAYLSLPSVAAVGGTWIATREDLALGRWDAIRDRCRVVRDVVSRLRSR